MKIIVDKVPEKPEECCFSKCGFSGYYCNVRNGYLCTLHTLNKCTMLVGLESIAAVEELPMPSHLEQAFKEYDIRLKEEYDG